MTPLRRAAAAALAAAADADDRLVCVAPPPAADAPGAAAAVAAAALPAFGDRVVHVAGTAARPWVAAGLVAGGRRPVVVLDAGAVVPADAGTVDAVVLTGDLHVADALLGAGVPVVQPAWPTDVAPLLAAALAAGGPVVLRLHDAVLPPAADAVAAPVLGRPRVLRSGGAVALSASGAAVGMLADVARMLAGRGADVTAVDQHTVRPGRGATLALLDGVLVVGGVADAGVLGRVRRVPAAGAPREVMEAVLAAVPGLLPAATAGGAAPSSQEPQ